jgi:zinc-finger binding domain of transposase IS66
MELVPARFKIIQHVRETFTCRTCAKITETPERQPLVR